MMAPEFMRAACDRINDKVNADITWASDMAVHGVPEFWTAVRGKALEDCDGFMLTKRMLLLAEGMPHERMFLELCYTETREYHAVLRVRLPDTDIILDNRQGGLETPKDLERVGYIFDRHIRSDGVYGWQWTSKAQA